VHTDGWPGCDGLLKHGHSREITVLSCSGDPAHVPMPAVHRVASLLRRWLLGTHQDGVGDPQLDFYLEKFIFRFNRRTSRFRGLLFYRLIEQAAATWPVPYKKMVTGECGKQHKIQGAVELNGYPPS